MTDDEAAYLERAQRLLAEVGELETDLRGAHTSPRGRLRVDVPAASVLVCTLHISSRFNGLLLVLNF